jgi:hypothetical protein
MRWGLMVLAVLVLLFVTFQGVKTKKSKKEIQQEIQKEKMWGEETNTLIDSRSGLPRFIQKIIMPR